LAARWSLIWLSVKRLGFFGDAAATTFALLAITSPRLIAALAFEKNLLVLLEKFPLLLPITAPR
jgi:hypothetical protein